MAMPTTSAVRRETLTIIPNQTYEDFAALPEGTRAQLIDGTIVMSPSPKYIHQHVVWTLGSALKRFVDERDLGVVLGAPMDVRVVPALVVQPDVLFLHRDRLARIGEQEIEGAPDLVVEVLSPSTGYYDLTQKREAYERAGVREYWIVDPERRTVEVLALEGEGYQTAERAEGEGRVASRLLNGFVVEVGKLFEVGGQHHRNR